MSTCLETYHRDPVTMGSISLSRGEQLQAALDEARALYTRKHSTSKKSHDEACLYMPGGNTRTVLHTSPFPFTIESAHGCFLDTVDGHSYVDFLSEYTAGIYGHNHPAIRAAIEKALDGGWNYGAHSKIEQDLAKAICTRFPTMDMIRFVNSGTEANMMALATALVVARDTPGKKKVLVFEKGYHGSTISGRIPSGKPGINLPHDFVVAKYNDVQGTKNLVASLPEDSLAAILVEPMLGSGGCYAASPDFLSTLHDLSTQHKALLIFDEVMTSRLSHHGFGSVYDITPDLMTLGKYLGGGMTFGAFGGREAIMSLYDPRKAQLEHPGTFNNNVFTMHAGVAGAKLLTRETLDALNERGDVMRSDIDNLLRVHSIYDGCTVPDAPVVDNAMHQAVSTSRPPKMYVKGVGSLLCLHFAGPDREVLQGLFWHHMLENGIYMAQRGFIALSIEISQEHVNRFVGGVAEFATYWEDVLKW